MRFVILLILVSVALIGCSGTASNTASNSAANPTNTVATGTPAPKVVYTGGGVKQLKELAGRRVREIELWDSKDIDTRLGKLMGGDDYAAMKNAWLVESPIAAEGDILMMAGCAQDNCAGNQYVMFVDVAKDNFNVQHFKDGKPKVYKEKGDIVLPEKFVSELDTMKTASGVK